MDSKVLKWIGWAAAAALSGLITALLDIPAERRMVKDTYEALAGSDEFAEAVAMKVQQREQQKGNNGKNKK